MLKKYLAGCLLAGIFAGIFGYPPLAGAQGVESYYLIHPTQMLE